MGPAATEDFHQEGTEPISAGGSVPQDESGRGGGLSSCALLPFQGISDDAVLRTFGKEMPIVFLYKNGGFLRDWSKKTKPNQVKPHHTRTVTENKEIQTPPG